MSIINTIKNEISAESQASLQKVVQELQARDNILIVAHADPDGDALGSSYALGHICAYLNKNFMIYNESQVPDFLSFLPKPKELEHDLDNLPFKPELIIILDCGDRKRIGKHVDKLLKLAPSINIDHHINNPQFGTLANWADTSMAATGNAVAYIALELDIPLKNELAFCLYTTLVTDTGSFSYGNTNARALLTAAHIVGLGLDPSVISSAINNQWTEEKTRLWAFLFSSYILDTELSLAYCIVSHSILEEFNCTKADIEGFVEQLRKIKNVRIAFVLREKKAFESKVSFRSQGLDDVQKLAMYFNGGGHKNAAGGTLKVSLAEARDTILETIRLHKDEFLLQA